MASNTVGELNIELTTDTVKFEKKLKDAGQSAESFGKIAKTAIVTNIVNRGLNIATDAVKNFATSIVQVGMSFEKSMSNVAAISGATGDELAALTAKAREMGENTVWSASDAADAMSYMAMAGWKTSDMLNGISGVMDLATAAGADLATTSDIVTDALTAFGLSAADSGRLADVMAAASSNANTNVAMMGETFKYAAPLAGTLGYSIEDTATAIGLMANAGIKGSQAGTAMRSMLTRLANPPKAAAKAMDKLGISITNTDDTMKPLREVLGDLRKGFSKLTEEEKASYAADLAGQEAMSGLLAIVGASDSDFGKLTTAIDNSNGAAAEMAAIMGDNLSGDVASLNSKFEAFQIELYNKVAPAISVVVDGLKWAIDNMQIVAPILGGLTAALIAFKVATIAQTIAQNGLNRVFLASPLPWIAIAIGAVVAGLLLLWNNCEGFRNFVMGFFDIIKSIWEWIGNAIGVVIEWFGNLWTFVSGVFQKIGEIAMAVFQAIWDFIQPIVNFWIGIFNAFWNVVSTIFGWLWENAKTVFNNVWQIVSGVVNLIKGAFQGAWNFIVQVFSPIVNFFKGVFTNAFNAIKNIFSGIGSFFQGIWNTITGIFTKIGTTIGNAVSGAFKAVVNGVLGFLENIVNTPVRAINKLIDVINAVPGINLGHLNELHLPRMEQGGIVPGNSYSGDHNVIRANSGEMVITRNQQAALWDMIERGNYGDYDDGGDTIDNSSIDITNNYQINSSLDAEEMGGIILESIRKAVA